MENNTDQFNTRATLLHRLRISPDDAVWDEFVEYYKVYLHILARRMNLAPDDADEVVQRVLIKVWKNMTDFDYDESRRFRGWLFMLIRNTARDFYRESGAKQSLKERAESDERWGLYGNVSEPEVEQLADREWKDYLVTVALENIRPHCAEKMLSIFEQLAQGKSAKQLAEETGYSHNTINVYRKRVRDMLRIEVCQLQEKLG